MAAEEKAIFRSVHVIGDAGTAFLCSVETKQVWVPLTEIRYGTDLTKTGDRGKLILSRWFAQHLDLR